MNPFVSVIIVNYNGMDFVDETLSSVLASGYHDFELIFVDNASIDGSDEYVRKRFGHDHRLKIIRNNGAFGPAKARNIGARSARGKYLIFFDNDTRIDKDCIQILVHALENDNTIGSGQAKLLRMGTDRAYDCAGDYLGPLGFLIERSKGAKDTGQFDYIADILSAKSAASIIRRELFEKIGGFDADYYMYLEETDLSWRVWLAGYRVVFLPQAVVYHAFNTSKKSLKRHYTKYWVRYYGSRNYISTLIKNLQFKNLIVFLPLHVFSWLAMAALFLLKGAFDDFFYILKGIFWNALNIDVLIAKHRYINENIRKLDDNMILDRIKSKDAAGDYLRKIYLYIKAGL